MKFLQVILFISFLLFLPLAVQSTYSLNDTSVSNKTIHSSTGPAYFNDTPVITIAKESWIDTSLTPYWLSQSGNVAFGFYPLPCTHSSPNCSDGFVVGIWFINSPFKTLVWTANGDHLLKQSSIHFTNNGNLVLWVMPDKKVKPLIPNIKETASYGILHDDGNLVFYGSRSEIVWQSFDHPTDTILGGQKITAGGGLVSVGRRLHILKGENRLSVQENNGQVTISAKRSLELGQLGVISSQTTFVLSDPLQGPFSKPVNLILDTTGDLYLVDSDGQRLKYLYKNTQQEGGEYVHIYRGTLDSRGYFRLFKERIDGNASDDESSIPIVTWKINDQINILLICLLTLLIFVCLVLLCVLLIILWSEVFKMVRGRLHKSSVVPLPARNHA